MKKIIYILYFTYIFVISCTTIQAISNEKPIMGTEIYYIDGDMLRLISVDFEKSEFNTKRQAEALIYELIEGRDRNPKIKRMIPKIRNCLTVSIKDNIAYVNISGDSIKEFPDGRISENLIVYQIVNSLTSIRGIDAVRFTIDGKSQKDFKGFIDMRETFIPDYYI